MARLPVMWRTLSPLRGPVRWPLLAIVGAVWPVAGVFTLSRAFVQRDLTLYFWPKYLWLRHTMWDGYWPWWDPYLGAGQSAAADALNQLFLLPTLAIRLLLPEPIGFNLWVALPFPLAAWGAYLYFRRYASAAAAALGAVTFAVSGPVVSTGNFPNLSWSVLFLPWLLWAVDRWAERPTSRRLACVALLVGAQACAGEPVTWIASAGLLVIYVLFGIAGDDGGLRRRLIRAGTIVAVLALGAALAAIQLLPLWHAARQSVRVARVTDGFWSVHPLALLESVAPTLFGNFFVSFSGYQPWMTTLNSGRDPFFYSLYVGMGVLLLALVGSLTSTCPRRTRFWIAIGAVALVGAFGSHTPIYPWLQTWVPLLGTFRYPAKYLVFVCFALAALVVEGWTALERQRVAVADAEAGPDADTKAGARDIPAARAARWSIAAVGLPVALAAYIAAALTFLWPVVVARAIYRVAVFVGLADPFDGVGFMLPELPAHAARLLLLALITTGLLWVALTKRPEARRAQWLLYASILADLAVTNGPINPTADIALMQPPAWIEIVRRAPHERFYFGGRLQGGMQADDPDAPGGLTLPPVANLLETRVVMSNRAVLTPSGVGLREMMSFDLTSTFPREYTRLLELFALGTREERLQLLRRAGVRYCVMREPLPDGVQVLARIPNFDRTGLFECDPHATRVLIVADAQLVPSLEQQAQRLLRADEPKPPQHAGLLDPRSPDDRAAGQVPPADEPEPLLMLKAAPPAAAGTPGVPVAPFATFLRDDPTIVEVAAGAGERGGYLLLRDSYDPSWHVTVDGRPAELLRANLLFRAVRLAPGSHVVRFAYRPSALRDGAVVSALASLVLLVMATGWRRSAPVPSKASDVRQPDDKTVVDTLDPLPALDATRTPIHDDKPLSSSQFS